MLKVYGTRITPGAPDADADIANDFAYVDETVTDDVGLSLGYLAGIIV